jgi:hypothetical protein
LWPLRVPATGGEVHSLSMLPSSEFEIALTVALYTEWAVGADARPQHLPPGGSAEVAIGFLRYLASIAHLQDAAFFVASVFA